MNIFSMIFLFSFVKDKNNRDVKFLEPIKNDYISYNFNSNKYPKYPKYSKIEDNKIEYEYMLNENTIVNKDENKKSFTKKLIKHLKNNSSIYAALLVTAGFTWLNSCLKLYKI